MYMYTHTCIHIHVYVHIYNDLIHKYKYLVKKESLCFKIALLDAKLDV